MASTQAAGGAGFSWLELGRPAAWLVNLVIYACYPRSTFAFVRELGYLPNIALPTTYNEKMFWRRIFDHDPGFVAYCDKLETKKLLEPHRPRLQLAQTLWTGSDPAAMPASLMRDDVVVKLASGCAKNWFFARRPASRDAFLSTCRRWLARSHGTRHGQWAYTRTQRTLLAEQVVTNDPARMEELKVHLFGGQVFYTLIYVGEKTPQSRSAIFDDAGRRLAVTNSTVAADPARALPADYRAPGCYADAMDIARQLAGRADYLRVDFMVADGALFGGEITPYPTAGLMTNSDPAVLDRMGRCWDLRKSWFLSSRQRGWRAIYQALLRDHVEA